MNYFLTSVRLEYRLWNENDFNLAKKLWGSKKVSEYIAPGGGFTSKEILEKFKKEIKAQEDFGFQYWPVFLKEENTFIGCCGLRPYNLDKNILEIGVHLLPEHWKKGYASESLQTVIEYAFSELRVSALFAGHNPKNETPKLLLLKLGFRYTHNEFYSPTGLKHPSYLLTPKRS